MRRRTLDIVERREAIAATTYTRQWHLIADWAEDTAQDVAGDNWAYWPDQNERLTRVRAEVVRDLENEEEAFARGRQIVELIDWLALPAPTRDDGGRRRVVIRIYTWTIDRDNEVAYDPEWIKVGDDMSARSARARAIRWAIGYDQLLQKGMESREIKMTAIEILWWTRGIRARMV